MALYIIGLSFYCSCINSDLRILKEHFEKLSRLFGVKDSCADMEWWDYTGFYGTLQDLGFKWEDGHPGRWVKNEEEEKKQVKKPANKKVKKK